MHQKHSYIIFVKILTCPYRKNAFNQRQHFIHLNLSIALLLGLIIFVSGIETANQYRVSENIIFQIHAHIMCLYP